MDDRSRLHSTLTSLDGQGYASYKRLKGSHRLGDLVLYVDHVQVDPYAPPSRMRVSLDLETAGFPADLIDDGEGRVATGDFIARRFAEAAREAVLEGRGSGNSGTVSIGAPGQQVLERTSVLIAADRVEARIEVGLPAAGRRVRGREAARLLGELLPRVADRALRHGSLDERALREHVTLYRDQEHLRRQLAGAGLVAFVGDGAILPRRSGDSDLPLERGPVPFATTDSLRVAFETPSGRSVTGMGIPEGVAVIVGGGYHGKSTLLRALERGVYPHIAGDGREWVVTRADAATIRAEDERAVTGVDISPFITNLPSGADTRRFSTSTASGSTSQAANLVEALDAGATTLLIDEDTSATNFMIRDDRMRRLIPADREPITPFVDRVRPLLAERGVSTVLVAGGSGAFFGVADHVIALDAYRPVDVTAEAHRISGLDAGLDADRPETAPVIPSDGGQRVPQPRGLLSQGKDKPARARGRATIQYGRETIDLSAVAQLVDAAQTEAIAHVLDRIAEETTGERSVAELVQRICARIDERGLDAISPFRGHPGRLARPRPHEIHAAVNRYRGLRLEEPRAD